MTANSTTVDPPIESAPDGVLPPETRKSTYGQILKSTALVGGASGLNVLTRMVRAKSVALMLGPAGFGLFSLFNSIATLAQSIAGMGINSSGVRQIAAAVGSGDSQQIARTTIVLRRISILLGVLGAVVIVAFAGQISDLTFGSNKEISGVRLVSLTVLLNLVSAGQGAL